MRESLVSGWELAVRHNQECGFTTVYEDLVTFCSQDSLLLRSGHALATNTLDNSAVIVGKGIDLWQMVWEDKNFNDFELIAYSGKFAYNLGTILSKVLNFKTMA